MRYCYYCMNQVSSSSFACPYCGNKLQIPFTPVRFLQPGTVITNSITGCEYLIGKNIGQGGFGNAYIALDRTNGRRCCIKEHFLGKSCSRASEDPRIVTVSDEPEKKEEFERYFRSFLIECERLRDLQDTPYVVKYYDHFTGNNTAYMAMEFLDGCTLRAWTGQQPNQVMTWEMCVNATLAILEALKGVHNKNIVHRDLSPDNVFVMPDGTYRLIDFGAAKDDDIGRESRFYNGGYTAPEVRRQEQESFYTDLYSVGAIMYFLLTGKQPVLHGNDATSELLATMHAPRELENVFQKAVRCKPRERYQSAEEMANALLKARERIKPNSRSVTNIQEEKQGNKGFSARTLLISLLVVLVLALTAVILWAALSDSDMPDPVRTQPPATVTRYLPASMPEVTPTPTPTPTPVPEVTPTPVAEVTPTSTPTPTPVPEVTPTPVAEVTPTPTPTPVPEVTPTSTPTPTPVAEVTPTPTPTPTATPMPVPKLTTKFSDKYILAQGSAHNIPLVFTHDSLDVQMSSSAPSVATVHFVNGELCIRAYHPGSTTITLNNAAMETESFTVEVVEQPKYDLDANASEQVMLLDNELILPLGVEARINLAIPDALRGYMLEIVSPVTVNAVTTTGFTVSASTQEHCVINISLKHPVDENAPVIRLPDLTVTGTPHVLAGSVQNHYALYVGEELTLNFITSDGQPLDWHDDLQTKELTGDVIMASTSYDMLSYLKTSDGKGLIIQAKKSGEVRFTVCGEPISISILDLPTLSLNGELLAHDSNAYTLTMPENTQLQLTVGNVASDLPLVITRVQSRNSSASLSQNDTMMSITSRGAADSPDVYRLAHGRTSITLKVNVVKDGPTNSFNARYDVAEGGRLRIPVTFAHDMRTNVKRVTSNANIATVSLVDDELVIDAKNPGNATITIGNVQFAVHVYPSSLTLKQNGKELTKRWDVYEISMSDLDNITLFLPAVVDSLAEKPEFVFTGTGMHPEAVLNGSRLIISGNGCGDGEWQLTLRYTKTGEVCTLRIKTSFEKQLQGLTPNSIALYPGQMAAVGMSFRDNISFGVNPNVISGSAFAEVRQDADALLVTAREPGAATIVAGNERLDVKVLDYMTLSGSNLTLDPDSKYSYTLTAEEDSRITLSRTDRNNIPVNAMLVRDNEVSMLAYGITSGSDFQFDMPSEGSYTLKFTGRVNESDVTLCLMTLKCTKIQKVESLTQSSLTLYPGQTAKVGINFAKGNVFDISPTVTDGEAGRIRFEQKGREAVITAFHSGDCTLRIGGQDLSVRVLEPVALSGGGLTGGEGRYQATVTEGKQMNFWRTDGNGLEVAVLLQENGSGAKRNIGSLKDNGGINIPPLPVGTHRITLSGTVNGETLTLATLDVTVKASELTTLFMNSYKGLLPDHDYTIRTSYSGNPVPLRISAPDGLSVTQSGDLEKLIFHAYKPGTYQVTVADQTFTVTVNGLDATVKINGQDFDDIDWSAGALEVNAGDQVIVEVSMESALSLVRGTASKLMVASSSISSGTNRYVLIAEQLGEESFTLYVKTIEPAGMLCAKQKAISVVSIPFSVKKAWSVSRDEIAPINDSPEEVMTNIIRALIDQGKLRGNAAALAEKVIFGDASTADRVFKEIASIKRSHSGFSSGDALNESDYRLLLSMMKTQATPAPTATRAPRKESFAIVDAALSGDTLCLMDKDGYLIQYSVNNQRVINISDYNYAAGSMLAGNGGTVLWTSGADTFIGSVGSGSIARIMIEPGAAGIRDVVMAKNSALTLLGEDSFYVYQQTNRSSGRSEEMSSTGAGYAFYGDTVTNGTDIVRNGSTPLANIKLIAAGEQTIAVAAKTGNRWALYVSSTNKSAPLRQALDNSKPNINRGSVFYKITNKFESLAVLSPADIAVSDDCLCVVQTNGLVYILTDNDNYSRAAEKNTFTQVGGNALEGILQAEVMDNHLLMLSKDGKIWRNGKISGGYVTAETIPGAWNRNVTDLIALNSRTALAINGNGEIMLIRDGVPQMDAFVCIRE